jgi:hypothetical protein
MPETDPLDKKAIELALAASDSDSLLKAIQAQALISDLQDRRDESKKYRYARSWATLLTPYTAIFGVILSLCTLAWQYHQFSVSNANQERAANRVQWREALKNMSLKDDSTTMSTVFEMHSFFDSDDYKKIAHSIVTAVLPNVASDEAFDIIFADLRRRADEGDQKELRTNELDLITIAQAVTSEDWTLYSRVPPQRQTKFVDFIADPTSMISEGQQPPANAADVQKIESEFIPVDEYAKDQMIHPLKRALHCSYAIDSMSKQLAKLWLRRATNPSELGIALSGIALENSDFSNVDFSNGDRDLMVFNNVSLAGSNFDKTNLTHTRFDAIQSFVGSTWSDANWWDSDALSCDLGHYLQTTYPPATKSATVRLRADALVAAACQGRK